MICVSVLSADKIPNHPLNTTNQNPIMLSSTFIPIAPLSKNILYVVYFGDIVFSISGALSAARYRLDIIGFVLIGSVTGIGGGSVRDLLLGRPIAWTHDPTELILCMVAALATYIFVHYETIPNKAMVWSDALGLAAFSVVGAHIALQQGSPLIIAVIMGMVTATGGGVIRDLLTQNQPMILCGEMYATVALFGSLIYVLLVQMFLPESAAETIACLAAFCLRGLAIVFNIQLGGPGRFISIGTKSELENK